MVAIVDHVVVRWKLTISKVVVPDPILNEGISRSGGLQNCFFFGAAGVARKRWTISGRTGMAKLPVEIEQK
jgi:hypothetical protein